MQGECLLNLPQYFQANIPPQRWFWLDRVAITLTEYWTDLPPHFYILRLVWVGEEVEFFLYMYMCVCVCVYIFFLSVMSRVNGDGMGIGVYIHIHTYTHTHTHTQTHKYIHIYQGEGRRSLFILFPLSSFLFLSPNRPNLFHLPPSSCSSSMPYQSPSPYIFSPLFLTTPSSSYPLAHLSL